MRSLSSFPISLCNFLPFLPSVLSIWKYFWAGHHSIKSNALSTHLCCDALHTPGMWWIRSLRYRQVEKQQQYATVADEVSRWGWGEEGNYQTGLWSNNPLLRECPRHLQQTWTCFFFPPWLCPKEKTKGASSVSACLPVVISSVFVSTCLPVVSRRLFWFSVLKLDWWQILL